ncbi:hypothetical protein ElyMa_003080200 [Elysia marginata]|uniref:Uncharacterized protein n=1 Tax=Elysia marginata TaxID=1093978 RepID=A0AAV4ILG9_9GAST|nr:hypothetical protein ElyMa_003080200 [Elysia marginata]
MVYEFRTLSFYMIQHSKNYFTSLDSHQAHSAVRLYQLKVSGVPSVQSVSGESISQMTGACSNNLQRWNAAQTRYGERTCVVSVVLRGVASATPGLLLQVTWHARVDRALPERQPANGL